MRWSRLLIFLNIESDVKRKMLVGKNKAEQERRSASSEIALAQYQSMINSYQVKIKTDSQNEENTIRG